MITKRILRVIIILFFLIGGIGCEDDIPSGYCKGKIVALNNHVAYTDIIEIQQSVDKEFAVGQTISVGVLLTDKGYKLNDIVYFKVISYQKWVGPETADHLWPTYTGVIELANK